MNYSVMEWLDPNNVFSFKFDTSGTEWLSVQEQNILHRMYLEEYKNNLISAEEYKEKVGYV